MEWVTVREASERLDRSVSTIRSWMVYSRVGKEKRGRRWYVEFGSLSGLKNVLRKKQERRKPIIDEEGLGIELCPSCESMDWYRVDSTTDDVVRLRCASRSCNHEWDVVEVSEEEREKRGRRYKYLKRRTNLGLKMDTEELVISDRKKYVQEYIDRGLSLTCVLQVFGPKIRREIKGYYLDLKGIKVE